MNATSKIKKQFKDFLLYYKLTKVGANASDGSVFKSNAVLFFSVIVVCAFTFILFLINTESDVISISGFVYFIPFASGAAIGSGMLTTIKPSMLSVSPFTPRQRVVFCYLAAIVRAIALFLFSLVCVIIALLLIGCISSLVEGRWVFVAELDGVVEYDTSVYESMFMLLLGIIFFFSFLAIGHMDNMKHRNISAILFVAVTLTLSLIVVNICGDAMGYTSFRFGINLTDGFNAMRAPWAVLIVEAVFAALAIAASVFFVRKRFASTEI